MVFPTRPSCPRPAIRGCGCGEHWPGVHSASLAGSSRSRKISPAFLCGRVTLCLEGDPFGLPGPWLANNQAYTSLAGAPPSPGPTPPPPECRPITPCVPICRRSPEAPLALGAEAAADPDCEGSSEEQGFCPQLLRAVALERRCRTLGFSRCRRAVPVRRSLA